MTYVYFLRRARKKYKCSICGQPIPAGALYIYHEGCGMATRFWMVRYRWCIRCRDDVVRQMLKWNVDKLCGYGAGYVHPKAKPLKTDVRRELEQVVGKVPQEQPPSWAVGWWCKRKILSVAQH